MSNSTGNRITNSIPTMDVTDKAMFVIIKMKDFLAHLVGENRKPSCNYRHDDIQPTKKYN